MKTTTTLLAIAFVAIASIGATKNVNAASKDTAKTNAAAIQQTDQGTFALFNSANNEGITFAATIEGNGIGTQTANWTGIGTQVNIGATNKSGTDTTIAGVVTKTGNAAVTKTTNGNTATNAAHYGTINVASNNDANEVFGGTGQVRILGS